MKFMIVRSLLSESIFLLSNFSRNLKRSVAPSLFYSALSIAHATRH